MKALFVAGTDTGVGKTIVTGLLARYLLDKGCNVITQKWVQTGCAGDFSSDIRLHLKIMGKKKTDISNYIHYVCPYIFKPACSPHLASKIENKRTDVNKIKKSLKILSQQFDFVIVEGAGGILVPLDRKRLIIDIVKETNLPVLLVAQNKLGAINHTLLTIEALKIRGVYLLGIVFNNCPKEDKVVLQDNPRIVRLFSGEDVFGALPRITGYDALYELFKPIAKGICKEITGSKKI